MAEFELWSSGIGSNRSPNCATTTAHTLFIKYDDTVVSYLHRTVYNIDHRMLKKSESGRIIIR